MSPDAAAQTRRRRVMMGEDLLLILLALLVPDTLLGVLLSHLSWVVSARRCLIIEGGAMHRGRPILYRGALLRRPRTASRWTTCWAR